MLKHPDRLSCLLDFLECPLDLRVIAEGLVAELQRASTMLVRIESTEQ